MISRRSFLTALGALPFVGKFLPKPEPEPWNVAIDIGPSYTSGRALFLNETYVLSDDDKTRYARHLKAVFDERPAHLVDPCNGGQTLSNMIDEACSRAIREKFQIEY